MVTLCRFCPFGQETSVVESSWPLLNAHIPVPAGKSGFLWNRGEGKISGANTDKMGVLMSVVAVIMNQQAS